MDVFGAVADPVRRSLVETLARSEQPVGDLAARFDVSRPAVSRHLRVLRDAGVVEAVAIGRQRVYRLRPDALGEVHGWVADVLADVLAAASPVAGRLDALDTEVRRTVRERRKSAATPTSTHQEETA